MRTHGKQATSSKPAEFRRINRNAGTTLQAAGAGAVGRRAVLLDRDGVINALVYHQDAGVMTRRSPARNFAFYRVSRRQSAC